MRIALRPSGGRGDYELAGSYHGVHASDLLEKNFLFQVTPALTIDGRAKAHRLSGKPRIRPEGGKHPYVVMSSILLLPLPRRELIKTPTGSPELRAGAYTLAGIDVDILEDEPNEVLFAPKRVWARSRGGLLTIDFADRMAIVSAIWAAARNSRMNGAELVLAHQSAVESGDHQAIAAAASDVRKHYRTDEDVLPLILRDLGLPDAFSAAYSGLSTSTEGFESEDDDSDADVEERKRARKWRRQADRGPGAREFSIKVRKAYDYRCIFSGERFPRIPDLGSAGVDGAHILPWSTHQLNAVSNGLCLCKLCHWAFDSGLLRLDYDKRANVYVFSIPNEVHKSARPVGFELERFKRNVGPVNPSSLPRNRNLWPSPRNIEEWNATQ
jgi:hypothetical protein